jgi:hypothetical protein
VYCVTNESSNIIPFPSRKKEEDEQFVAIVEDVVAEMLAQLDEYGYKFYEPKDIGLIAESLVSAMKRTKNTYHPLQELSDSFIHIVD